MISAPWASSVYLQSERNQQRVLLERWILNPALGTAMLHHYSGKLHVKKESVTRNEILERNKGERDCSAFSQRDKRQTCTR